LKHLIFKTAAFALPILNRLVGSRYGCVRALIIAPTRELAEQIHQAIETLGRKTRLRSVTVYGGVGINPQIQKLKHADIVVACPGRLLDHIRRHSIDLSQLEVLVIDEADRMFDMGFMANFKTASNETPDAALLGYYAFRNPSPGRGYPARSGHRQGGNHRTC
jgi:ATP-dependent RNA helicase RhlE